MFQHNLSVVYIWVRVMMFNVTFNNISVTSAVSFIGGGNRNARRKPSPSRKSLTTLSHGLDS